MILDEALHMLAALTRANRLSDKREALAEASGRLDALRITLRLAKRLGYLSNPGYESLTETADEVGRMLGGWLKYERGRAPSAARGADVEPEAGAEPRAAGTSPAGAGRPPRKGAVRYTMQSPLVERYLNAKLAHPTALVLVQAGAFCQAFFEDAQLLGRELGSGSATWQPTPSLRGSSRAESPRRASRPIARLGQAGREVRVE